MSDAHPQLNALFVEAFQRFEPRRPAPDIHVGFYPYAGLHHTIRLRSGRIYVRLSDIFHNAPASVHRALAFILIAKLLRRRVPDTFDRLYREYACAPEVLRASDLARRHRGRKMTSSAQGKFYNLDKLFDRINRSYFENEISKPTLSWSQRRTRRILGHHDAVHDTIIVSKTLDSGDVPQWFVEYILYHEMLHIKHPARLTAGRRIYHTKAFRHDEQRFSRYAEAQAWLDGFARRRRIEQHARAA